MSTRRMERRFAGAVATAMVLASLAACSDDAPSGDQEGEGGRGSTSGQDAGQLVRTVVVPGKRVGQLSPQRHRQAAARVATVVDGWWDAAFVDGDYPRSGYQGSFPGFTRGAAAQAWRQRDLTTSARLGERIDALVPLRRKVAVDVLATRQVPRAATARVRMDYRTTGEVEKRIRVQGRLLLTFDRGWRVFGFDLTQGPWTPAPSAGRPAGDEDRKGRKK